MEPTLPTVGAPGETDPTVTPEAVSPPPPASPSPPASESPPSPPAASPTPPSTPPASLSPSTPKPKPVAVAEKSELSSRLEQVAALLAGVVGLEFLAVIIGVSGGGAYRTFGDRIEVLSLNMDAKMGLILLVAAMLATLRDVVAVDFRPPRSDAGRGALIAVTALGILMAVLALVGIGLDISRSDTTAFGTNAAAAVVHRLSIVLMAGAAVGWALTALGIRVTTAPRD
jgi:hypothetical protein